MLFSEMLPEAEESLRVRVPLPSRPWARLPGPYSLVLTSRGKLVSMEPETVDMLTCASMFEGSRTCTSPLAVEKRMSPPASTRVSSTSTSPLALLALTVPAESATRTVPLAEAALICPLMRLTLTSPLAVESVTRPLKPSARRLPLAVEIFSKTRLDERGTRTSNLTLASQLQWFG